MWNHKGLYDADHEEKITELFIYNINTCSVDFRKPSSITGRIPRVRELILSNY